MTLDDFNRDLVPGLEILIGVVGLLSLFLLWWQLRQTTKWNRLQAENTFLGLSVIGTQKELFEAASKIGIVLRDRLQPLTPSEVEKLWTDDAAHQAVMTELNNMETVCTAVQAGVVDPEIAFSAHALGAIRKWNVYSPYISRVRKHYGADEIFDNFEKTVGQWQRKVNELRLRREQAQEGFRQRWLGVRPRV